MNPSSTVKGKESDGHNKCELLIGNKDEIVASISRFYNNEEMSDIVLKLGTQRYYAHKFVLLLMSDVFRTMCSKRWDNTKVNEIELNECDQCAPVFPLFLHFLYHGQVYVNTTTALPLLMLADKYNVQSLKTSCEEYVQKQVKDGNVVGAIRWLPYLQLCGHSELEEACIEVIVVEMEYVLSCNDFLLLNIELLVLLLGRDDLVVPCENTLYEGVVKWLGALEEGDLACEQYLETLLPLIRFSMMFPEQLLEIETSSFYQLHSAMISPFLSLAHRFRSLAPEVTDETFSAVLYHPRNYTNPLWCQYINLDADNVSFYNKCINLQCACDLLTSSSVSREPTWQVQIARGEKSDSMCGNKLLSPQEGLWLSRMPGVFPSTSVTSCGTIPLQMSLRPLKPIRPNMIVDISVFLMKKDVISKHLDSTSFVPPDALTNRGSVRILSRNNSGPAFRFTPSHREKLFQPSPMHFSFTPPPQIAKEPEIILKYRFSRDELDTPPEAPCVSFGPNFNQPPRPIHSIRVAIITKPRFKSSNGGTAPLSEDSGCAGLDDSLPILG